LPPPLGPGAAAHRAGVLVRASGEGRFQQSSRPAGTDCWPTSLRAMAGSTADPVLTTSCRRGLAPARR
jgi:hypothetical protein